MSYTVRKCVSVSRLYVTGVKTGATESKGGCNGIAVGEA